MKIEDSTLFYRGDIVEVIATGRPASVKKSGPKKVRVLYLDQDIDPEVVKHEGVIANQDLEIEDLPVCMVKRVTGVRRDILPSILTEYFNSKAINAFFNYHEELGIGIQKEGVEILISQAFSFYNAYLAGMSPAIEGFVESIDLDDIGDHLNDEERE